MGIGLQLERFSSPMSCCFQMECRRWAPTHAAGLLVFSFSLVFDGMLD